MPRGHRLCRTPHAGGALAFLCDQESKQRSRRECDSPFPTNVGTENRTFPGLQFLPVLRHQCNKKSGVLVNRTVNRPRSGQPGATPGVGLQPAVLPSLAPGRKQQINRTVIFHSGRTPGSEPHRALRESESSPPTAESRPAQSRNRVCAESYTVPNKKD